MWHARKACFVDWLSEAFQCIQTLRTNVAASGSREDSVRISEFLEDARRFVLANRFVSESAPLQLYSSAIIFAPQNSIVGKVCGQPPAWIQQCPITPLEWSPELQKLEGHTYWVHAVAFLPNSSQLASGSPDRTVRLWDAKTGQELQKLEGHTDFTSTVAFSPEGSQLASGSGDRTVQLWDAKTGQGLQKLKGTSVHEISSMKGSQTSLASQGDTPNQTSPVPSKSSESRGSSGLKLKGEWIEYRDKRLLWLPP